MRNSPYLTVQEVADFYRISRKTVERWCREARIKTAHRVGRHWAIYKNQFKDWPDA